MVNEEGKEGRRFEEEEEDDKCLVIMPTFGVRTFFTIISVVTLGPEVALCGVPI